MEHPAERACEALGGIKNLSCDDASRPHSHKWLRPSGMWVAGHRGAAAPCVHMQTPARCACGRTGTTSQALRGGMVLSGHVGGWNHENLLSGRRRQKGSQGDAVLPTGQTGGRGHPREARWRKLEKRFPREPLEGNAASSAAELSENPSPVREAAQVGPAYSFSGTAWPSPTESGSPGV